MKGSNKYFASHGVGYFLMLPVIILSAAAMVLYAKYGVNIYATEYSSKLYLCGDMAIGFAVLSMAVDLLPLPFAKELVKPIRAVSYLLLLYTMMQYVLTQIMFLGAVQSVDSRICRHIGLPAAGGCAGAGRDAAE